MTGKEDTRVDEATVASPIRIRDEARMLPTPVPNISMKIPPKRGTTVLTSETEDVRSPI